MQFATVLPRLRRRVGVPNLLAGTMLAILVGACGSSGSPDGSTVQPQASAQALSVKSQETALGHSIPRTENVTITTEDGTAVAMTVYYPLLGAGQATPLLLHSHGFGSNRIATLDFDEATQTSEIGQDAMQLAWNVKNPVAGRTGWYIISYDQAGHGDSGGNVNIMDPTVEGVMLKAVLDWAEANLPNLAYETKGSEQNPVIGTIGRSYGGAFQLMAAGIDDRVDAMVPGGTWYDLRTSLNPNGVPKTAYLNGLVISGQQSIQGRFEPFLFEELTRANTTNQVTDDTVMRLGANGAVDYCSNEDFGIYNRNTSLKSDVPALFVQGARDVLFNLNESIKNFACYRAVNSNSRLMFMKYGHSLDALGLQESPSDKLAEVGEKYAFNEPKVWLKTASSSCPAGLYDTETSRCVLPLKNIMFQFLADNLLGEYQTIDADYLGFGRFELPEVVAVLEDGRADPSAVALDATVISPPMTLSEPTEPSSLFEQATGLTGLFSGLTSTQLSALAQPVYKPLSNGTATGCYVGTPVAEVEVAAGFIPIESPEPPIVFLGLGLTRADGSTQVLHEQVVPVKGYGTFDIPLPGISVILEQGDSLSLAIQGYNPVFLTSFNKIPAPVQVTAQVSLPEPVKDGSGFCK